MRYEPFQQDGKWWFGVTQGDKRPPYKTGACASGWRKSGPAVCLGHWSAEGARAHMREWLLEACVPCQLPGVTVCEAPHLFKWLQSWLWRRFDWIQLPAVTSSGYACTVHLGWSVRLCARHRTREWLKKLMPQPEEMLQ